MEANPPPLWGGGRRIRRPQAFVKFVSNWLVLVRLGKLKFQFWEKPFPTHFLSKNQKGFVHPNIRGRARPFEFTLSVRPRPGFLTARSGRFSIAFRFRWSRLPGRPPPLQRGEQDRNNSAYGAPSQPVPESDGTGGLALFSEVPTTRTFRARTWCFGSGCERGNRLFC